MILVNALTSKENSGGTWIALCKLRSIQATQAKGKAEAVLEVLEGRGVKVDDASRPRLLACRDADLLRRWLVRATTVGAVEEIFG